jgi:hypothetical protein
MPPPLFPKKDLEITISILPFLFLFELTPNLVGIIAYSTTKNLWAPKMMNSKTAVLGMGAFRNCVNQTANEIGGSSQLSVTLSAHSDVTTTSETSSKVTNHLLSLMDDLTLTKGKVECDSEIRLKLPFLKVSAKWHSRA